MNVIIVGAGLFGSIAAALARKAGHTVTVIDNAAPLAASKCAACLFKPSWLESLGKEKSALAYGVLRQLYRVQKVNCVVRPLLNKHVDLDWVDPQEILLPPDITGTVERVGDGVVYCNGGRLQGRVLVAAGVYTSELVDTPPIRRLVGASLRAPGRVKQPGVYVYAPYRQAIAFNITSDTVWFGDGTAILEKNWDAAQRVKALRDRAKKFYKVTGGETLVGARPYAEGYPQGLFWQTYPRTWVSTGGAKNGTVLAAYQAKLFVEAL